MNILYRKSIFLVPFLLGLLIASTAGRASAQGLLGVSQHGSEISESEPLRVTVTGEAGYDSNSNTAPDGAKVDSYFAGGGIGVFYAFANDRTRLDLGGNLTALYYDQTATDDNVFYNGRLTANLGHRISRRLEVTNNGMIAYEIEPDYLVAASTGLRDDQYLFWFNRTAVHYALTQRIASLTSYNIQGIDYERADLSAQEDRLTHVFAQQIQYALDRQTSLRAEYRYAITDYDRAPYDSKSHYALAGFDHHMSEYTMASFVGGAEYRNYDLFDSYWSPYAEAGIRHRVADETTLQWMGRIGLEDNEIFGFKDRFTYRTGLYANHTLTPKLRANGGFSYIYSQFDGADLRSSIDEHAFSVQAGLAYRIFENVDLTATYYFTKYDSDDSTREYDRHRVTIGATANF